MALARAIVYDPQLLLMDEPIAALDKQLREEVRSELRMLQKRLGITVIYVTHDQDEALSLADRVAVMSQGIIEQVATPREVYRNPSTPFVAGFVGEGNFLPARAEERFWGDGDSHAARRTRGCRSIDHGGSDNDEERERSDLYGSARAPEICC